MSIFRKTKTWEEIRFEHRWDRLADYNSEVSHGIVHTAEYEAKMAAEQAAFDHETRQRHGGILPPSRPDPTRR